jgi:NAD(P)-dependent dehydrogenase (short-subunit alcohol dehydrogenase family)/uncharacterized protein YndB with AHSA1/START domain
VIAVPTDTADPAQVERLAAAAEREYGRIDAWVNNAGVAAYGALLDLPLEEVRRIVDVDLFGYLYGARAAVPRLRAAGGGVLVMVASMLSEVTFPYLGAYNIAKHGVLALCDTLRQELRLDGAGEVSVCAVLPAVFETPLYARAGNRTGRALRPPPPAAPAVLAGRRIVRLLEHPRRQVRVGGAASTLAAQWRLAPAFTERLLGWYASRAQFRRGHEAASTSGNLFQPQHGTMVTSESEEPVMSRTERTMMASPEDVFAVLSDGWTYSDWVVGTAHIRDVDADWPVAGTRIRHKVGPWPFSLHGETGSVACQPPTLLVIRPTLWPLGELTVRIGLTPTGFRSTRVVIEEKFSRGPLLSLRNKINDVLLHRRNDESLRRLADLVQRRNVRPGPDDRPALGNRAGST